MYLQYSEPPPGAPTRLQYIINLHPMALQSSVIEQEASGIQGGGEAVKKKNGLKRRLLPNVCKYLQICAKGVQIYAKCVQIYPKLCKMCAKKFAHYFKNSSQSWGGGSYKSKFYMPFDRPNGMVNKRKIPSLSFCLGCCSTNIVTIL